MPHFVDLRTLRSFYGCRDQRVLARAVEAARRYETPGIEAALKAIVAGTIPELPSGVQEPDPAAAYVYAVEALCTLCEGESPNSILGSSWDIDAVLQEAVLPRNLRFASVMNRPPLAVPYPMDVPLIGHLNYEEAVTWARALEASLYALLGSPPWHGKAPAGMDPDRGRLLVELGTALDYFWQLSGAGDRQAFLDEDEEAPPAEDQWGLVFFYY